MGLGKCPRPNSRTEMRFKEKWFLNTHSELRSVKCPGHIPGARTMRTFVSFGHLVGAGYFTAVRFARADTIAQIISQIVSFLNYLYGFGEFGGGAAAARSF